MRTTAPRPPSAPQPGFGEDIFEAGEVIGRIYEIRGVLGAGGMGQVFEAQDHSLDRRVAIKANWPSLPAPPLRNEARALAAFRHPSLVTVHGIGVHRSIDYIVMERIYGVSLADTIDHRNRRGEPLSVEEVLRILRLLAQGLLVVHLAGIAHRDIKPGNVMLTPDHRVVLMDFGLVLPEFDMTRQTGIAGSPPYMAPEALANVLEAGSGQLVDVYALGVTGWEMLTGRVPHSGADLRELWEKLKQPPRDVRSIRPDVPEALAALLAEMMHRDPAARVQSAEQVAWQIERIEQGDRRAPRDPGPASPLRVMVVEDDPDVARVVGFYARKALGDVELVIAPDGARALELLRGGARPDVMLLDLHMPRMNGVEVAMCVRGEELAQGCAIVAVSAGAQEHDRQLLHQLGIRHFVLKGPQLAQALGAVLRAVAQDRTRPLTER